MKKRIISWLLTVAIIVGLIPTAAVTALASESEAETVSDAYISVSVSRKNGGFTVKTVEGDRLKKSDNNKKLLYPVIPCRRGRECQRIPLWRRLSRQQ